MEREREKERERERERDFLNLFLGQQGVLFRLACRFAYKWNQLNDGLCKQNGGPFYKFTFQILVFFYIFLNFQRNSYIYGKFSFFTRYLKTKIIALISIAT